MQAAELLALPAGRQEMVIRSCHRRRRAALLEECLWRGPALRGWDHGAMVAHLELAVRLVDVGDDPLAAVRARMQLGNAYRIVERYPDAAARFDEVAIRLDPALGAGPYLDLELFRASHSLAGEDWRKALRGLQPLLGEVEGAQAARAYLHLGRTFFTARAYGPAARALSEGLRRAERHDLPMMALVGLGEMVRILLTRRRGEEALRLFERMLPLCRAHGTPLDLRKMESVEAHVVAHAGDPVGGAWRLSSLAAGLLATPGESPSMAVERGVEGVAFAVEAGAAADAAAIAGALRRAAAPHAPRRLLRSLAATERQAPRMLPRLLGELALWKREIYAGAPAAGAGGTVA